MCCGIVGAAGVLNNKEKDAVRDLLIMDALRGKHSTGLIAVNKAGEATYAKKAVTPYDFLDMASVYKKFNAFDNRVLVGHNRYATKGAINNTNAHPFSHGDITGVHNGTIRKQHRLVDHKDFEVDSENIIHSLNKVGEDETVKNLEGAYALVWWNNKEQRLKFLRNSERPLFFTASEDAKTIYWASEKYMLKAALHRNGLKHQAILPFEEDMLYTFDLKLGINMPQPLEKPTVKKLVPYIPPIVKSTATANRGTIVGFHRGQGAGAKKDYLDSLGYTNKSEVPFYIGEVAGTVAFGSTLDQNEVEVRVHCGTNKEANNLLHHDGFYMSKNITGYGNPVKGGRKGYISVGQGMSVPQNWESVPPLEPSKVESRVLDENGVELSRKVFNARFKAGCCCCNNPLSYDIPTDFDIIKGEVAVCTNCRDLDAMAQFN